MLILVHFANVLADLAAAAVVVVVVVVVVASPSSGNFHTLWGFLPTENIGG